MKKPRGERTIAHAKFECTLEGIWVQRPGDALVSCSGCQRAPGGKRVINPDCSRICPAARTKDHAAKDSLARKSLFQHIDGASAPISSGRPDTSGVRTREIRRPNQRKHGCPLLPGRLDVSTATRPGERRSQPALQTVAAKASIQLPWRRKKR